MPITTSVDNSNSIIPDVAKAAVAVVVKAEQVEEDGTETSTIDGVFHRKSKRRRVARDIFLVFEEQPSRRRGARGGGSAAPKKSKFGHLKVENPSCRAAKGGLLRDIKNEPKCYLNNNNNNNNGNSNSNINNNNHPAKRPASTKAKNAVKNAVVTPTTTTTTITPPPPPPPPPPPLSSSAAAGALTSLATANTKTAAVALTSPPTAPTSSTNTSASAKDVSRIARVNPIFLWVKQEDTRIVEVRCEDYDKRNRIRLTKTTNGWQAIPRTDPTTSRIVKFFQTPTMLKVKRELYASGMVGNNNTDDPTLVALEQDGLDELAYVPRLKEQEMLHTSPFADAAIMLGADTATSADEPLHLTESTVAETKRSIVVVPTLMETSKGIALVEQQADVDTTTVQQNQNQNNSKALKKRQEVKKVQPKRKNTNKKRWKRSKNQKTKKEKTATASVKQDEEALVTMELAAGLGGEESEEQSVIEKYEMLKEFVGGGDETTIVSDSGLGSQEPTLLLLPNPMVDKDNSSPLLHETAGNDDTAATAAAITKTTTVVKSDTYQLAEQEEAELEELAAQHMAEMTNACKANGEVVGNERPASGSPELQLCPKTGLFMRNLIAMDSNSKEDDTSAIHHSKLLAADEAAEADLLVLGLIDAAQQLGYSTSSNNNSVAGGGGGDDDGIGIGCQKQPAAAQNLEVETKNLKDLLDDADDLLQHCGDNTNSDAELIDSLVQQRSCENHLIRAGGGGKDIDLNAYSLVSGGGVSPGLMVTAAKPNVADDETITTLRATTPLVAIDIDVTVAEPPKCLSFNEAGEIEGINGELYQSSNYCGDSYAKESNAGIAIDAMQVLVHDDSGQSPTAVDEALAAERKAAQSVVVEILDDTPKDLSYKKREEVCPPSESRSQCAVTSSSDVLKLPPAHAVVDIDDVEHDGTIGADRDAKLLAPVIESTTETFKNLIYEQFIKMNAYNVVGSGGVAVKSVASMQQMPNKQKQLEPIDLGTHKQQQHHHHHHQQQPMSNSSETTYTTACSDYIETVVLLDDASDEEPLKKRTRNALAYGVGGNRGDNSAANAHSSSALVIDMDPDPLTQLQLLIKNTQWKVPDPILVPKERLSAVLASPAREIPLLITTRPELRLPEAFAYPEIIQNPNILVISMAQLEAILKNEMELDKGSKTATPRAAPSYSAPQMLINQRPTTTAQTQAVGNNALLLSGAAGVVDGCGLEPAKAQSKELKLKCAAAAAAAATAAPPQPAAEAVTQQLVANDLNAATLAVLNQLLWLPYFGQLSQEFFKTLKEPTPPPPPPPPPPLPPPPSAVSNVASKLMPTIYNQAPASAQYGLQNLDELYKYYNKQLNALRQLNSASNSGGLNSNNSGGSNLAAHEPVGAAPPPAPSPRYTANAAAANPLAAAAAMQMHNPLELAIFQKLIEQQMHNLLRMNAATAYGEGGVSVQQPPLVETPPAALLLHNPLYEQQPLPQPKKVHGNGGNGGNSGNKSIALSNEQHAFLHKFLAMDNNSKQHQQQQQQHQQTDSKPRLTCKSLSNLLEPESVLTPPASASIAPPAALMNFGAAAAHSLRAPGKLEAGNDKLLDSKTRLNSNTATTCHRNSAPPEANTTTAALRALRTAALSNVAAAESSKQRKRCLSFMDQETAATGSDVVGGANSSSGPTAVAAAEAARLNAAAATADSFNAVDMNALWHPLFGSNTKAAGGYYSSPWQWTTVTATGE